jgi:hypothetical protein
MSSDHNNQQCHILNGDSLKAQFPSSIQGEIIVARECLVDGNVKGVNFDTLMANRAEFIGQYPDCSSQDYYLNSVPEFEKIIALGDEVDVICWFEDDLFCQVNFWYVLYLLVKESSDRKVWLVRPNQGNEYSFAAMSEQELVTAYHSKISIDNANFSKLAMLWPSYQNEDFQKLQIVGKSFKDSFPYIITAVEAHIARIPDENGYGYPERVLLEIMKGQKILSFKNVFREFHQKMAIYSFGDLQVNVMYERLIKEQF